MFVAMDIFVAIISFFIVILLFSLCGACCRKRTAHGAVIATPVIITSEVHRTPGSVVVQNHATGTAAYPAHTVTTYPVAAQYPPQAYGVPQQPYAGPSPQQASFQQQPPPSFPSLPQQAQIAPIPGMGQAPPEPYAPAMYPPSYDQVMHDGYATQAPYNPNFTGGK